VKTPSLIVRYVARRAAPFIQLYALYVLGHGEDGPGGGFQGGVIFASSFVLLALAKGRAFGRAGFPEPWSDALMPTGCIVYAGTGFGALLLGGAFLQYEAYVGVGADEHARHLAHHLGLIAIEIGVMITVTASMVTLFFEMARVPELPAAGPGAEGGRDG
jgi:multicomponent Na+:H+ antiporter subunit B